MQEYSHAKGRSVEGSVGGVPSWLLEEQGFSRSDGHSPGRISRSSKDTSSRSPDTRRKHYRGTRQQQRDQRYTSTATANEGSHYHPADNNQLPTANGIPLELRNRPQHQMIDSMQRMRASEPIYMDIDPSIHQSTMALAHLQEAAKSVSPVPDQQQQPSYHQHSSSAFTQTTPSTAATSYSGTPSSTSSRSPSRHHHQSRSRQPSNSNSPASSRGSKSQQQNSPGRSKTSTPSPTNFHQTYSNNNIARDIRPTPSMSPSRTTTTTITSQSPKYPYVHPYVSNVAREHRVPGGMFHNQPNPRSTAAILHAHVHGGGAHNKNNNNNNTVVVRKSLYDERPIRSKDQEQHNQHGDNMIMFGDDYDLGSINTGMSQQELLQKRRDVKKRREGKYGKKKKNKERIINMPPRLLSSMGGSWDTSPITKLTSKDNSQHAFYKESKEEKWNIMRAFTPPDEGSTDASTRESGEDPVPRPQDEQAQQQDNASLNSFPLLSTNAKEGLSPSTADARVASPQDDRVVHVVESPPGDAPVHYAQPGNIPQLQVDHLYERQQRKLQQEEQQLQQQIYQQQLPYQPTTLQQLRARSGGGQPHHMETHYRQHGEELIQLENHLRSLQDQHQQLEQEVQAELQQQPTKEERPRVRFAATLAQDLEEKHYEISSKDSPTSVTDYGYYSSEYHQHHDTSSGSTSVLAPKNLFTKPVSILRRKTTEALDSTGRYPAASSSSSRGRSQYPVFKDDDGRELSPIRSGGAHRGEDLYQFHHEDVSSLPEHLEGNDVAVVFDPDHGIEDDLELMRREFDEESILISDAFIEAVASIVLQTAIRRFLAIRKARRLRIERGLPVKQMKNSLDLSASAPTSVTNPRLSQQEMSSLSISNQSHPSQEELFYDLAAIQIQSVFRGWWVRDSINVDHYCSTLIQKAFRGFRARCEFDYDVYRIIVVQSIWRRNIALRRARWLFFLVIKLQSMCRGVLVRRTMGDLLTLYTKHRAAKKQSRRTYEKNRSVDRASPSHIRTSYEKAKAGKKSPQPYHRGSPVRHFGPSSMDEAKIWHVGAIIIQTYWRSYVCRICFFQSLADVVLVQSVVRGWLTRRQFAAAFYPGQLHKSRDRRRHTQTNRAKPSMGSGGSPRFVKFESFESRNMSSLGADESLATGGSVPFRNLSEEDAEQDPRQLPTRMPNEAHARSQHQHQPQISKAERERQDSYYSGRGYFEDGSRFGGARNVWNRSGAAQEAVRSQAKEYRSEDRHHGQDGTVRRPSGQPNHETMVREQHGGGPPSHNNGPTHQPQRSPVPRSTGWNPDEDIDKESTRNLLQAWKKKDKANTFTIQPRSGR